MKKTVITLSLLLLLSTAAADEAATTAPVPEPPKIPPQVESGEVLEPEVTILEDKRGTVHQYSVNGRVYMVKIVPSSGPAYYLLDTNGDGELDVRQDHHPGNIAIPQWVLFSW